VDRMREACFDKFVEEVQMAKPQSNQTPLKSANPKKLKRRDESREVSMESELCYSHSVTEI